MQRQFAPQSGQVGGNVLDSFQRLNQLIEKNDGVRSFSVLTNNCFNVDAPFSDDQQTHIRITNNVHDINQLAQSYIRMELEADVRFDTQLKGASTLNVEGATLITAPKETKFDINPNHVSFISYPSDPEAGQYYKVSDGSKYEVATSEVAKGTKSSDLLLYCESVVEMDEDDDQTVQTPGKVKAVQICRYGCSTNYRDIVDLISRDFVSNAEYKFTGYETKTITEFVIKEQNITAKTPTEEHKFYQKDGTSEVTTDNISSLYMDGDVAPLWFKAGTTSYLLLVHKYNKPWNPEYKTQLSTKGITNIIEIDLEYWKYLFANRTNTGSSKNLIDAASSFITAGCPTHNGSNIVYTLDGQTGYDAVSNTNITANNVYWISRQEGPYAIALVNNAADTFPIDVVTMALIYDRLERAGHKLTWVYSKMPLTEFQKTQLNSVPIVRLFIGWKNANEVIKQLQIENCNVDTKYMQRESAKEGFCYSTFKPNEEKKNNLFAHTTYENARTGFRGVCGGYIEVDPSKNPELIEEQASGASPYKIKQAFTVKNLEVILPITDILCFRNFEDYPGALGDIVLKMYLNKNSMVYAQCDPKETFDQNYFVKNEKFSALGDMYNECLYTRGFTQVGQKAKLIEEYQVCNSSENRLSVTQLRCTKMTCECYGYNVSQDCKKQLVGLFQPDSPFVIPANQIDVVNFPSILGSRDSNNKVEKTTHYSGDLAWALKNVSKLVIVFPKHTTDQTTFCNPMLNKVQLRIQGKQYPQIPFANTYDSRFYAHMIRGSDVGSFYEADPEYINSLLTPIRSSDKNTLTDVTSFLMTFQTERSSDNVFFDGIETGNENVNIQFECQPTEDTRDEHFSFAPQIWLVRETYWTADIENGLRYWSKGTPEYITE